MSATDHLSGQFDLHLSEPTKNYYGDYQGSIHARVGGPDGPMIGKMRWNAHHIADEQTRKDLDMDRPLGQIQSVSVHPDYRRQGVATAMLEHARSRPEWTVKPTSSPERSDSGDAWAQRVHPAGTVPERTYNPGPAYEASEDRIWKMQHRRSQS